MPVFRLAPWLVLCLVLAACGGSAPVPPPEVRPSVRTDAFLVDPLLGFPLEASDALEQRVRSAWRALRGGGESSVARLEAVDVLEIDPGFHPAVVLLAQVDMLDGDSTNAVDLLQPIAEELPAYEATQRVLALAAESIGDVVLAYQAVDHLPESPETTAHRDQLRARALDVLRNRFDDAIGRGRFDQAELVLGQLQAWADTDPSTTERAWRLTAELGDDEAERHVLERLLEHQPERRDAIERLAELEIASGALRQGLARLESLLERHPDDRQLAERVERAKFRWRLETFPEPVRVLASKQALSRSELAALIYWFVPEVRHSPLEDPPVATDILDHEMQDEIVRVLNASLMEIDPAVHRFSPDRPAIRGDLIAALLRVAALGESPPACVRDVDPRRLRPTLDLTCELAGRCMLIPDVRDCLSAAPISGDEALELFRTSVATRRSIDPGSVDPGTIDQSSVDPGSVDQSSVDPGSVDPGSVDPN